MLLCAAFVAVDLATLDISSTKLPASCPSLLVETALQHTAHLAPGSCQDMLHAVLLMLQSEEAAGVEGVRECSVQSPARGLGELALH